MKLREALCRWIDERRENILSDIAALVEIESVRGEPLPGKPFGAGPAAALDRALEICARLGLETHNCDYYAGFADLGDGERELDILVHLDVVAAGDGWKTDPFKATLGEDGLLYGRGADDDKGPAVAAMYAMAAVKAAVMPTRRSARLIMGTNEESGFEELDGRADFSDLHYYYAKNAPAPNTFSPDTSFPVRNTEKGDYKTWFNTVWETESVLPRIASFDGGYKVNVLPAEASAVIEGLEKGRILELCAPLAEKLGVELTAEETARGVKLSVSGAAAHASTPEMGVNGITALVQMINALPLAECASTRAFGNLGKMFPHGDHWGRAAGIAMADDIAGRLTLGVSILRSDETGLEGRFDSRTPLCADEENCAGVIERLMAENGFSIRGRMNPAHHVPDGSAFISVLNGCYESVTGNKGGCIPMGGSTYAHFIDGAVAFGAGMPGFESNLHGANERADPDAIIAACKVYALAILEMLCPGSTGIHNG